LCSSSLPPSLEAGAWRPGLLRRLGLPLCVHPAPLFPPTSFFIFRPPVAAKNVHNTYRCVEWLNTPPIFLSFVKRLRCLPALCPPHRCFPSQDRCYFFLRKITFQPPPTLRDIGWAVPGTRPISEMSRRYTARIFFDVYLFPYLYPSHRILSCRFCSGIFSHCRPSAKPFEPTLFQNCFLWIPGRFRSHSWPAIYALPPAPRLLVSCCPDFSCFYLPVWALPTTPRRLSSAAFFLNSF